MMTATMMMTMVMTMINRVILSKQTLLVNSDIEILGSGRQYTLAYAAGVYSSQDDAEAER